MNELLLIVTIAGSRVAFAASEVEGVVELEALIADYRQLHQDDARLRRIERIIHAARRPADDETGDRAGEIRE